MNRNILRLVASLPGIAMGATGVRWLVQPEESSKGLGMPLLDGIGRSTQIGDFSSFFLGIATLIFLGIIRYQGHWLYAAALFLGAAAVFRTAATVFHGTDMATAFIISEIALASWLVGCGYLIGKTDAKIGSPGIKLRRPVQKPSEGTK
ncbi:MAG: hypothetical protein CMQ19_06650 [Gammaproteobacteria bacterium]|nr:hypothetical protein [Gammaproteobacteria bacterium]|tara:strand:+ start:6480 stop:6926 length:447 start_codon:yes stop_codon:yes gene_type:complete